MAGEVLLTISRDEVERARLLSEYKYIVDTQSKVVQAEREGAAKKQAEILAFSNGYNLLSYKELPILAKACRAEF
jgi:hypothetical protein